MPRKKTDGKLVWQKWNKNVNVGVFDNTNIRKTHYGIVSIVVLSGKWKDSIQMSIPAFYSLIEIIESMPPIDNVPKIKKIKLVK